MNEVAHANSPARPLIMALFVLLVPSLLVAQEPICAKVRIEIAQELTLERQAFIATMRIENTLTGFPLTDVNVAVSATDSAGEQVELSSNPDSMTARFFLRLDALSGIDSVGGSGTVAPATTAEAQWLIVPAAGAAGSTLAGEQYFIGATLRFKVGREAQEVAVAPDFITVRPMPALRLDYFIPFNVHADDPLTQPIEPVEPFTVGVRVKNSGVGPARAVAIESAQPRIVDNQQGLVIGFQITSSFVQDQPVAPTLLMNFGDIPSTAAKAGRWIMETTLSGRITNFSARFSHASELGGRLTSLITGAVTHTLIRDVLVDLPGRDAVRDFLADDAGDVKLYESEGLDSLVTDYRGEADLAFVSADGEIHTYTLTLPATAGAMYFAGRDPFNGVRQIRKVTRSDGKALRGENFWISRTGLGEERQYSVELFDTNSPGRYTIEFGPPEIAPRPPVIQYIPNRKVVEGTRVSFLVESSDPDGQIPALTIDRIPVGATFTDRTNGTGIFDWATAPGQSGRYPVTFRASDGVFEAVRTTVITIGSITDSDLDGLPDAWENETFGNLDRDGTGDYDGDGKTDREEYEAGTDPTWAKNVPGVPSIFAPLPGTAVDSRTPLLVLTNSEHGRILPDYEFEVFADPGFTNRVFNREGVPEGSPRTSLITTDLTDNTHYYWRARARLNALVSDWVQGVFFVNTANDAPLPFYGSEPAENAIVATTLPTLVVTNSRDPDGEMLTYSFEVNLEASGARPVASVAGIAPGAGGTTSWKLVTPLTEDTQYWWRATAADPHGAATATSWYPFFVSTTNDAPTIPLPLAPVGGESITATSATLRAKAAQDPEGGAVVYLFELDTVPTFDSGATLRSLPIAGDGNSAVFTVSGLLDATHYYWRVKASDGAVESAFAAADFVVALENHAPSVPTVLHPGDGSVTELSTPTIRVSQSTDPDGEAVRYEFELAASRDFVPFMATASSATPEWTVPAVTPERAYFVRVRAVDARGLASAWSPVSSFVVSLDGKNDPPVMTWVAPLSPLSQAGGSVEIRWTDADPDSDARITLYANSTPIAKDISEDADDGGDTFLWNIAAVTPGTYAIRAEIRDEASTISTVAPGTVTVLDPATSPVDSDGDGVPDSSDNCPFTSNPTQSDRGGLLLKRKDGIGDACQCGDVTGDGLVNAADVNRIRKGTAPKSKVQIRALDRCNVGATPACTAQDAKILERLIAKQKKLIAASKKKKKGKPVTIKTLSVPSLCDAARAR